MTHDLGDFSKSIIHEYVTDIWNKADPYDCFLLGDNPEEYLSYITRFMQEFDEFSDLGIEYWEIDFIEMVRRSFNVRQVATLKIRQTIRQMGTKIYAKLLNEGIIDKPRGE